jgi:3-methyladenine DNA glycosylase AlkD
MKAADILKHLKSLANPEHLAEMERIGINTNQSLGISIYDLRKIAKEIGVNHKLIGPLWASGIHEARILASYIADPKKVTEALAEEWVADFTSWDTCDQVVALFEEVPFAWEKAVEWAARPEEFVKRAGFALMAGLAAHDAKASNAQFEELFVVIVREATDERNMVKKAVNWALRNIGKRNLALNERACMVAREIQQIDSRVARWIASDALRELTSDSVQIRLRKKL